MNWVFSCRLAGDFSLSCVPERSPLFSSLWEALLIEIQDFSEGSCSRCVEVLCSLSSVTLKSALLKLFAHVRRCMFCEFVCENMKLCETAVSLNPTPAFYRAALHMNANQG